MPQHVKGIREMSIKERQKILGKKMILARRREVGQWLQKSKGAQKKIQKYSWEIRKVKKRPLLNGEIMRSKLS